MTNVLLERSIEDIKRLAMQGFGIRAISRSLGISKNTVKKYYPAVTGKCACGQSAGHKGWCKHRYEHSPARRAMQAARSGRIISVPDPIRFSRLSDQRKSNLRWEGKDGCSYQPLEHWEMYSAIGEAHRVTKKYPIEFREDVCQELILGAIEGRIRPDEMHIAGKHFLTLSFKPLFSGDLSLDEMFEDGGSKYEHFIAVQPIEL